MCRNLNKPIPEKLANPPQITLGDEFYLEAYLELDTERSKSMGIERIPFSSIVLYGQFYGLSFDECSELLFVVRLIDNAMVKYYNEKNK
jgi:hypothetical protein